MTKTLLRKVIQRFSKPSRSFLIILGFELTLLVGVTDYATRQEMSFYVFYSVPIFLVAWFVGRQAGVLVCIASAMTWLGVNLMAAQAHLHPIIHYWNMTVRLGFFMVISFILSALKSTLEREKALARQDALTGLAMGEPFLNWPGSK